MKITSETLEQSGHQLHRLILKPAGSSRGTLIFFHGQGDFIDRYPPILEPFTDNGLTCILTDLPGHGRSSGKRGHVPGLKFIDQLLDNALVATKGSCHIAGHSMGGMMALRCFLRDPSRFQSAWFSSPLLAPARQTTPCMSLILPKVARLFRGSPGVPACPRSNAVTAAVRNRMTRLSTTTKFPSAGHET